MKTKNIAQKLLKLFKEEMLRTRKNILKNIYLYIKKSVYNLLWPSRNKETGR